MSVCAVRVYDNRIEIGADSQITADKTITSTMLESSKIFEKNGMVIAGAGTLREINLLRIFMETNLIGECNDENILRYMFDFKQFKQSIGLPFELECQFILVYKNKAFSIVDGEVLEIPSYYAIGSGQDFAQAILHLGHDVDEAVKVACDLNVYCHLPLKKIIVEKK